MTEICVVFNHQRPIITPLKEKKDISEIRKGQFSSRLCDSRNCCCCRKS